MRLFYIILIIIIQIHQNNGDDSDKYGLLRGKCQRNPTNVDCLQLKSKFFELIKKCQKIQTEEQLRICQQVKIKLCSVFPSTCVQSSTKKFILITQPTLIKTTKKMQTPSSSSTITTKLTRKKLIKTPITSSSTKILSSSSTTTTTTKLNNEKSETITNEEFSKVPVNPDDLRERGEYCIRHGKEKKCQDLLNNLKNTYSSCAKKKPSEPITKTEQLDCHSFQSHLCKAFPKFPPCIKKSQT